MDIKKIQTKIKSGEYEISYHAEKERYAEDIDIHDLETAILNGEILEEYVHDSRGPSCLILGLFKRASHTYCLWLYKNKMD